MSYAPRFDVTGLQPSNVQLKNRRVLECSCLTTTNCHPTDHSTGASYCNSLGAASKAICCIINKEKLHSNHTNFTHMEDHDHRSLQEPLACESNPRICHLTPFKTSRGCSEASDERCGKTFRCQKRKGKFGTLICSAQIRS